MKMRFFFYCPVCNSEAIKEGMGDFKRNMVCTDGWGQPVKFVDCECGSKFNGCLNLDYYLARGCEVDDGLIGYLKHRINFYFEPYKEEQK